MTQGAAVKRETRCEMFKCTDENAAEATEGEQNEDGEKVFQDKLVQVTTRVVISVGKHKH